jgi:hypothetical protein
LWIKKKVLILQPLSRETEKEITMEEEGQGGKPKKNKVL